MTNLSSRIEQAEEGSREMDAIQASLTEAQRRAIGDAYYGQRGWTLHWHYKALDRCGVTAGRCLTPLGIALRARLETQKDQ